MVQYKLTPSYIIMSSKTDVFILFDKQAKANIEILTPEC